MRPALLIWGAGGHAKVVLDIASAMGYSRIQLVDDAPPSEGHLFGWTVSKPEDCAILGDDAEFVVAIGKNRMRAGCFERALKLGWRPATLIHPAAFVSSYSLIGCGSVVMPKAVVNAGAVVHRNCIVNTGAVIEHDCSIWDHVHVSPGVTLGGNVSVRSFAQIGMGASVLPGVCIGENSIVGAGAVVLKSVGNDATVVGVPARPLAHARGSVARGSGDRARVLLSVPHMGGQEQQFVAEAFASNWLSTVGPNITEFEKEFGERLGSSAVAVSSGTAAIHLGLRALGVGAGDTVFCSDFTFVASANPIVYLGAQPVFIDSERESWNMDPAVLAEALADAAERNQVPKAVVVVHLFGQCADMDPILEACGRYGVPVLEDAAEALGATYKGRPAGTMGQVAAFSFNGNKMITTTGGGMLVSRNRSVIRQAQFWATQAREPGIAYHHEESGYNYRMSNVLAGIGRGQLLVLDQRVRERRAIAFRYADAFAGVAGISPMPQAPYGTNTNWLSCFLIDEGDFGCSRDELVEYLDRDGIESRPVWKPMHMQPLFQSARYYGGGVCEDLFRRGICLPSSSSLSAEEQTYVIDALRRSVGRHSLLHLAGQLNHCDILEPPALTF